MSKISLILASFALPLMLMTSGLKSDSCRSSKVSRSIVQEKTDKVATGIWGGEHIRMQVTESGARIEYDCAHGSVDEPLALDHEGHLDVKGTHARERGGPVRRGDKPNSRPARYTGRVEGRTLTLTVTLTDSDESAGTFTLTQGEQGRIRKCL
jgi:hypothetical protein